MTDIGTAQSILDFHDRLSRIDLVIEDDATAAQDLASIRLLSNELNITEASRRNNALQQMTTAFHTNLLAMSLLAILVGAFLIYNTATLSVLERRTVFGQMRLLGVQRGDLFIAILLEIAGFAMVGIIAGLILGYALGGVLLHLVTRTINDLYFTLDVHTGVQYTQTRTAYLDDGYCRVVDRVCNFVVKSFVMGSFFSIVSNRARLQHVDSKMLVTADRTIQNKQTAATS